MANEPNYAGLILDGEPGKKTMGKIMSHPVYLFIWLSTSVY